MSHLDQFEWQPQDEQSFRETIQALVRIPSITGTDAEAEVARYLSERLRWVDPAQPATLISEQFLSFDQQHIGVAALYRRPDAKKTIVVIAHTDVVGVDDYGPYSDEAFDVATWTHRLRLGEVELPPEAQFDLSHGEWWFGRGVMDMKAGLALNLVMFEKACREGLDGNIVFLAVPDEESHSRGMIAATELLRRWANLYDLDYQLCLNTEPSFVPSDAASGSNIYSGTFGKMLLGAMAVGVPGHVGLPFSGLSAIQMVSQLAQTLESNTALSEQTDDGRIVPLTCLWLRDLQETYSVQSPHMAAAFFHVPFFKRAPSQVLSGFRQACEVAMANLQAWTADKALLARVTPTQNYSSIPVVWLSELMRETGQQNLDTSGADWLDGTLRAVKSIAMQQHVAQPRIILFLAPPVYPAVDASNHPLVQACISRAQSRARNNFGIDLSHQSSFPGLCDLSYTGYDLSQDWASIVRDMPVWGSGYTLPLQTMRDLSIPVLNLGPFGKDAHQWTERLNVDYTTRVLPHLYREVLLEALSIK